MIEKRRISKWQLKTAFEYFNTLVNKPGVSPVYSLFISRNHDILAPHYMGLSKTVYNEQQDPEHLKYRQEITQVQEKYAAKDEAGNIIRDEQGNMHLSPENREAFDKDAAAVNEKYKDLLNRVRNKETANNEIYNQLIDLDLMVLTLSEFVNDAPPFIVGMFAYGNGV